MPTERQKPDTRSQLVLIVDDEMDMRLFLSTLFESAGFSTIAVRNGDQGLAMAMEHRPALIILDVMMPGSGGAKMYQALKSRPNLSDIPVIMLSAVDAKAYEHFIQMLNAQSQLPIPPPEAYVEKPPDPKGFLALAKKILTNVSS